MLDYFFNAGFVVKLVMLILLLTSVVSWAIIFHRGSFLKQARRQAVRFQERFWDAADLSQVYGTLNQRKSDRALAGLASIFQAGFKEFTRYRKMGVSAGASIDGIERALAIAEAKELDKLEQGLPLLATIGSTSPYIGLLGTVWGIMTAFQALGTVQQASIASVAPGISEALVATAMGLFAAIPAVIAYNRLSNSATRVANQYGTFREELLTVFARQLQSSVATARAPSHEQHQVDFEDEEQYV